MKKSFFAKDVEMIVYGPVPGKPFYIASVVSVFVESCQAGVWPKAVLLFRQDSFVWLQDMEDTRRIGEKVFREQVLVQGWREEFNKEWQERVRAVNNQTKKLDKIDWTMVSDEELKQIIKEFVAICQNYEGPTVMPELANYGAGDHLERLLRQFVPKDEIEDVMQVLTAPEKLSFNQREEIDLSKATDLDQHRQNYVWLQNGFGHPQELTVEFFAQRKKELGSNIEGEHEERLKGLRARKEAIRQKYKLTDEIMMVAREIWLTIVMQDERKKYNFLGTGYLNLLLKEVARRSGVDLAVLEMGKASEVLAVLAGEDLSEKLEERLEGYGLAVDQAGWHDWGVELTNRYWQQYVEGETVGDVDQVEGVVACRGKREVVQGRVRVVKDPSPANAFAEGDILVAAMTSPDYVFLMRKAAAIITNFGGLTSHAAIVSRELNTPCIIGTKIATQVLKDGDMVEVDADRGRVKIVS